MSAPIPLSAPLAPGAMIGILGGGQLGRMLSLAAAKLGFRTHIYSDETESCGFNVATETTRAAYDDQAALAQFAAACDVVTFEFENVPDATAHYLADHVPVAPDSRALAVAQDRFLEKNFVAGLGIATAPFRNVLSASDAAAAFAELGGPAVLKTRTLGYDGKGQRIVRSAEECVAGFAEHGGVPAILEKFVDFAFEASIVAARGRDGAFAAFDPPMNEHENHILRRSTVPAPFTNSTAREAITIARKIADALDYVGVLGVELFIGKDGEIAVNEIAPRVHNSGHWTMEACVVSQFEQHIRAVVGWPLGDAKRHSDAIMDNIIGAEVEAWQELAGETAGLHIYGKRFVRPGRKMGHITRLFPRLPKE
ncbi:MAG TPA: 5-(carboxyamino)imidazole ribonucleotide synthase [Micropepsaceae bacterium]|nr:5-(carboxyamino)imidazole ribonucleotide synthase [Micropepsaceae bacterium]